ncbi:DNA-directed RNA polymerase, partial [Teratosphaeriaceae sp. CCFEE 6253]
MAQRKAAGLSGESPRSQPRNRRKWSKRQKATHHGTDPSSDVTWPAVHKVKFGVMLIQKLMAAAQLPVTRNHPRTKERVTQMQPAFLHRIRYSLGKKIGVLVPNPALLPKLESEPVGAFMAKRMPMVVEPKPWTAWAKGGYLHYPTPILRLGMGDRSGRDYFMAADAKGDLAQVYAGVTALGKVPWRVHEGVLRVQIDAWNSGEGVANFAPMHPDIVTPPEPEEGPSTKERWAWLQSVRDADNKRAGLHSK